MSILRCLPSTNVISLALFGCGLVLLVLLEAADSVPRVFTNSFLVEFHDDVSKAEADKVAHDHGFENAGPVSG